MTGKYGTTKTVAAGTVETLKTTSQGPKYYIHVCIVSAYSGCLVWSSTPDQLRQTTYQDMCQERKPEWSRHISFMHSIRLTWKQGGRRLPCGFAIGTLEVWQSYIIHVAYCDNLGVQLQRAFTYFQCSTQEQAHLSRQALLESSLRFP